MIINNLNLQSKIRAPRFDPESMDRASGFAMGLIYTLLFAVYSIEFLEFEFPNLPRIVSWSPELVSGLMLVAVIVRGATAKVRIPIKYLLWGVVMFALVIAGVIANDVGTGAIFYGVRKYFRYLGVFLFPFAFAFSQTQTKDVLSILLLMAIIQLPFTIWQYVTYFGASGVGRTGDVMMGTLGGSSQMSVYLLSVLAILTSFYLKKLISLKLFVVLASIVVTPTLLNETTGTLFVLPVALGMPFLVLGLNAEQLKRLLPVTLVLFAFLVTFIVSYNAQFSRWGPDGILGLVFSDTAVEYVYRDSDEDSQGGSHRTIGRLDAILLPFAVLDDPVQALIGVGIGNASTTFNEILRGEYQELADSYGADITTISAFVWELGMVGLLMSSLLVYLVFRDAKFLARNDNSQIGALGAGVASVSVMLLPISMWINIVDHAANSYLMWFLFGLIGAYYQRHMDNVWASKANDPKVLRIGTVSREEN